MGIYGHSFDSLIEQKNEEKLLKESDEILNEGILLGLTIGVLKGIGIFLAANALIIGAVCLMSAGFDKQRKLSEKDVLENPKSKDLIIKSIKKLQEFVYLNLPNDVKRFAEKPSSFDFKSAENGIINLAIIEFDSEKMVKALVPGCKSVADAFKQEFPYKDDLDVTEDEYYDRLFSNPDDFINLSDSGNKLDYSKYVDITNKCEDCVNKINKEISKSNHKGTDIKFYVDGQDTLEVNDNGLSSMDPDISIRMKLPKFSISSFSDQDIEFIAKTCGVKVEDIKGAEEEK